MFAVAVPAASTILMLFVSAMLECRHPRMVPRIAGPGCGLGLAHMRMRPWSGGSGATPDHCGQRHGRSQGCCALWLCCREHEVRLLGRRWAFRLVGAAGR